jgi:hypothetical protein
VSGRVTKLGSVCACGAELKQPATGRPRTHCSDACKQKAYRARQTHARLTAKQRELLRLVIDLRRREQLVRAGGFAAVERAFREQEAA